MAAMPILVRLCLLLLTLLFAPAVLAQQQSTPARIVSMNVCTDQLLLLLVDKSRIASLSYFAVNPAFSNLADLAAGVPVNRGQADEVMVLEPDLVLTSAFSASFAATVLQRLQQPLERLGFAATREEVFAQIAQVAAWTGSSAQATAVIRATRTRIADASKQIQPFVAGKKAVFLSSNGIAFGAGTLQDDFLHSLGMRNIAAEAGLHGPAPLPLELLLAAAPDFVISEPRGALDQQLAHPLLLHPALQHLHARSLVLPERWFDCAGPWLAEAYVSMAKQVRFAP
jgi:iron complex transport system substrate-binding protein